MRITGGERKGQVFNPSAKNWPTRPTTDIAKEALYNILANSLDFQSITMLDLFGGMGSHSWELLSRGCRSVVYVDQYVQCTRFVKAQAIKWGYDEYIDVVRQDVRKFLLQDNRSFDYIFADPPYQLSWIEELSELTLNANKLNEGGVLVIEHDKNTSYLKAPRFEEERKYGMTRFSFFR